MNLTFETDRLLQRPLKLSDAENMFAKNKNTKARKYLRQTSALNIDKGYKNIKYVFMQYERNKTGCFATIINKTGAFIG